MWCWAFIFASMFGSSPRCFSRVAAHSWSLVFSLKGNPKSASPGPVPGDQPTPRIIDQCLLTAYKRIPPPRAVLFDGREECRS